MVSSYNDRERDVRSVKDQYLRARFLVVLGMNIQKELFDRRTLKPQTSGFSYTNGVYLLYPQVVSALVIGLTPVEETSSDPQDITLEPDTNVLF